MYSLGHELHPIRRAAAAATPSLWVDAVVTRLADDGTFEITDIFTGGRFTLWNHRDVTPLTAVGELASYHPTYGVVALGPEWLSVETVEAPDQAL